ncbi:uncharacterized protein LOC131144068 [Malania oleifera]|uniref:uncharacterized protein LOC131144068 n=1 Tax=Malania oleifera TaxID=397392 RepID=UPI0025AE1056|nr:uncharacterized protein LOC131144068 [Malania oleifera]
MRRQDSQLSSTSRREMGPGNHHATSIGCMSGIFQLLCTYHIRRKFLTLGKKTAVSCPKEEALLSKTQSATESNNKKHGDIVTDVRRLSCEVPRSPTIPADIRRWNSINSPDNCGTPPALVARLMGLEGVPAQETAAEKRRKLLGALEKCDEDLKALKKIIEALRSAENLRPSPVVKNVIVEDSGELTKKKRVPEFNGEQPSPVSVLDEFTRSPPSTYAQKYTNGRRGMRQQKQQLVRKKPGEDNDIKLSAETAKQVEKINADESSTAQQLPWYWSSSGGMIETVEEVRRDIAWGEKREVGRIGLALQDHICRDLIEETVKEMGCCCIIPNSLPLEACKRRLCF